MSRIALSPNASGTGTLTIAAPNTNADRTLNLPDATTELVGTDTTQTLTNKTIQGGALTLGTPVASTSGTSIDFTGIPSWAKRVTVMFNGVSTSGTNSILVQLGDSGGIETTGYNSTAAQFSASILTDTSTDGFIIRSAVATNVFSGSMVITKLNENNWVSQSIVKQSTTAMGMSAGDKSLSATLDRIRITTVNGTDAFDAGTINIMWEG